MQMWLLILLLFVPGLSLASPRCADVYLLNTTNRPPSSPNRLDAWQTEQAPHIHAFAGTRIKSGELTEYSLDREGSYPFLIFANGDVMISHRLPVLGLNPSTEPFLATHNSLMRSYRMLLGENQTELVFAGEIVRDSFGKFYVNNKSGHFHEDYALFQVRSMAIPGSDTSIAAFLAKQHQDLALATDIIKSSFIQLANRPLKSINYAQDPSKRPVRGDIAHKQDKELAEIELNCRADADCFKLFQQLSGFTKTLGQTRFDPDRLINEFDSLSANLGEEFNLIFTVLAQIVAEKGLWVLLHNRNISEFNSERFLRNSGTIIDYYKNTSPP